MGAAPNYVLTISFIFTQPSLSPSSHFPQGSDTVRKEPIQPRDSSVSELCISLCVFVCLNARRCVFVKTQASVHHGARLSGHCWRHRLSQRILIGSAGNDELEVDEVEMS